MERFLINNAAFPPTMQVCQNLRVAKHSPASSVSRCRTIVDWLGILASLLIQLGSNPSNTDDFSTLAKRMVSLLDPHMTWEDVIWLRRIWKRPLILKGILHPDDALKALEVGVDGIVVSNHGGRQLDCSAPPILMLGEIVAKVDQRMAVFVDGGIRRGTDIFKALALGADACLIGRPQLWGLAIGGQIGVEKVLDIFYEEIDLAMGLSGASSIADISKDLIFMDK